MAGPLHCCPLGLDVDARAHETQRVCVVPPLRDYGTHQGRQRVPAHTQPISPRTPTTVVPDQGLPDVECNSSDHAVSLR
ncbi:hypothetical protein DC74_146 [Streptomyces noursei]|nr:hypothetical protein DC74_146 [Streptomyces noursei]